MIKTTTALSLWFQLHHGGCCLSTGVVRFTWRVPVFLPTDLVGRFTLEVTQMLRNAPNVALCQEAWNPKRKLIWTNSSVVVSRGVSISQKYIFVRSLMFFGLYRQKPIYFSGRFGVFIRHWMDITNFSGFFVWIIKTQVAHSKYLKHRVWKQPFFWRRTSSPLFTNKNEEQRFARQIWGGAMRITWLQHLATYPSQNVSFK